MQSAIESRMLVCVCRTTQPYVNIMKHHALLFVGDSITDAGRAADPDDLGFGYVRLVRDMLWARVPDDNLEVCNRGVGGDTIRHLAQRWDVDVLAQEPSWLSVSIGVNDVWRQLQDPPSPEAVEIDEYSAVYRALLTRTRAQLPNCRFLLCEPTPIGEEPDSPHNRLMTPYLKTLKTMALEFEAHLVPMQRAFWTAKRAMPSRTWTTDGVHPASNGHMLMAQTFVDIWERIR